jgi:hypothetical protein
LLKRPNTGIKTALTDFLINSFGIWLIFDTIQNQRNMKHRDYKELRGMEHHPRVSIGLFFIVLGAALLIATNDLLNLGSISSYFTWETAMIFVGLLLLLNLHFTGGILLIAGGLWFLKDEIFIITPEEFKTFYWPAVIALIGVSFILSSLLKRNK